MRKRFAVALVVSLGLAFLFHSRKRTEPDWEYAKRAVVAIHLSGNREGVLYNADGSTGTLKTPYSSLATGFVLTPDGYIVTVAHGVIEDDVDNPKLKIEFFGAPGMYIEPHVIYLNTTFDVAVLKVDTGGIRLPFFNLAREEVKLGDKLFVIGHPRGLMWSVFETMVSNKLFMEWPIVGGREETSHYIYQIEAPIAAGVSGGPILNSKGEVACIAHAALLSNSGWTQVNFCVPSEDILRILGVIGLNNG